MNPETAHIGQPEHSAKSLRDLYAEARCYPSSDHGDVMAVRCHIAYWCGSVTADRTKIRRSRGHSLRVEMPARTVQFARVTDSFDHRYGVTGLGLGDRCLTILAG